MMRVTAMSARAISPNSVDSSAGSCWITGGDNTPCNVTQGSTVASSAGSSTWRRSLCQWGHLSATLGGPPLPHDSEHRDLQQQTQ
eukprot:6481096-Amphidinium_carterae.3